MLPLELGMTSDALLAGCLRIEHMLIFRAVRSVTAETIESQIGVTRINDFVADRMSRMLLPVVASTATVDYGRILEQKDSIAGVGLMAGRARAIRHRYVLGGRFCLSGDGISMAVATNLQHGPPEESFLRRGMGGMAVHTACFIQQRPMYPIFQKGFIDHFVMAALAELIALLLQGKRCGAAWIFMTLVAHLV